ncbi:protein kinase [Sporolactobacillus sp. CPB3-1]|uniref:Protein kinase n=1 Tax=Sporolactobacillus mangiferae TaxID=2940498 RepID=A0ABT0MC97_9BACL|nr:protein kinase [Sporolactobacillus mangiferae]MCL1632478.1 protein kinase [Sporolactobacillus mangiferae]
MMTDPDNLCYAPGTMIVGKWHRNRYQLIRLLGSGAQGTVYLGHSGDAHPVAIKLAKDRSSLISEAHILEQFGRLQGDPLGPSLYDSDDWVTGGSTVGFCVMEYLEGTSLSEVLKKKAFDWSLVYVLQLLKQLAQLHKTGYIFGDLKPENLMLIRPGYSIRCLDFGGATKIGRSVREYTEFYDRGYWGLGSRRAEPSYDLFACAMILIYAAAGRRITRSSEPQNQLKHFIDSQGKLVPYRHFLLSALSSDYTSAEQMRKELVRAMMAVESHERHNSHAAAARYPRPRTKRKSNGWTPAWLAASMIITAYIVFVVIYVM